MFHDAYDHVDSSGSSGISPATTTAFLTNPEGQDGTDATVEAEDEYRHTTDTSGMAGGIERESADVSLDTDAFNSQESDHMVDEEYTQEMEEPLDQFFTRYEEDTLMPCGCVVSAESVEPFADLAKSLAALDENDYNSALGHALAASLGRPALAPTASPYASDAAIDASAMAV